VAAQSVNVYLPKDLSDRLDAAKAAGTIDVKTVVKEALTAALSGSLPDPVPGTRGAAAMGQLRVLSEFLGGEKILPLWTGEEGSPVEVACRIIERSSHPVVTGPGEDVAYELVWSENLQEFQARLDAVTDAGGRPLSVAITAKDRVCLLVAWSS
jgi:hypothetical protein